MKLIIESLLGTLPSHIWIAGMIWAMIGAAFIKVLNYPKKAKFNLTYWLNDNLKDVLLGFLSSLIILRLGNYAYVLVQKYTTIDFDVPPDFVMFMILIAGAIQYYLHKKRKPFSVNIEKKMIESNKEIK